MTQVSHCLHLTRKYCYWFDKTRLDYGVTRFMKAPIFLQTTPLQLCAERSFIKEQRKQLSTGATISGPW